MLRDLFLMKKLLNKEVCGFREQCMGPIDRPLSCRNALLNVQKKKKKERKKNTDAGGGNAIQTPSLSLDFRGCVVHHFKQPFSVFKQHYTYFQILFYPHVFPHIFSNNKKHVFKCMYQTIP